jgi:hypothetical protein
MFVFCLWLPTRTSAVSHGYSARFIIIITHCSSSALTSLSHYYLNKNSPAREHYCAAVFFSSLLSLPTVFLHEAQHHENFTRTVDEIMNGIASKHADIEINYQKIPYDRRMDEKLREGDGK